MDSQLFEQKLLQLQDNLLNFAYMLTSDRDEAEDLLQDTTLKALDNSDKYIDNINFKGWVFTIMRNIFINNYRKGVRNQTIIDQTEDLYHLNLPQESGFDTPEGSLSVKEISKAINKFPDDYKIPFSMHVAGFKYQEIAEKMELPLGTVKAVYSSPVNDCKSFSKTTDKSIGEVDAQTKLQHGRIIGIVGHEEIVISTEQSLIEMRVHDIKTHHFHFHVGIHVH